MNGVRVPRTALESVPTRHQRPLGDRCRLPRRLTPSRPPRPSTRCHLLLPRPSLLIAIGATGHSLVALQRLRPQTRKAEIGQREPRRMMSFSSRHTRHIVLAEYGQEIRALPSLGHDFASPTRPETRFRSSAPVMLRRVRGTRSARTAGMDAAHSVAPPLRKQPTAGSARRPAETA